jgi:hypothetical protein
MNSKKKCPYGLDWDPVTGRHILPKSKTYHITDHSDGKTFDITEHSTGQKYTITEYEDSKPIKQEIDTDKLLAEAHSLIEYNKRNKEDNITAVPKPTKREQELEESKKKWDKISYKIPSTIFNEIEKALDY